MKGIVFNLLEDVVISRHGEVAWDRLLEASDLTGAYTSLGSYPDDEMTRLLEAGASVLGMPANELLRWFGREAMPLLAHKYPNFFERHTTLSFVLSANDIIHPEVRKLYTGAGCPHFQFEQAPRGLLMRYTSQRKMCALAHGFIEGAGDHFGETATVEHVKCMHAGDAACLLRIDVAGAA